MTLTARPDGNAVESLSLNAAATAAASGAGLTVTYTSASGLLSITGAATTAVYQTILQGILYNNTSDTPTTSNRSITVVASDGTNVSSTSRTATITVTAVNDAPVVDLNAGGAGQDVTTAFTEQTPVLIGRGRWRVEREFACWDARRGPMATRWSRSRSMRRRRRRRAG